MSKRPKVYKGEICNHTKDETCPHYENAIELSHKLELLNRMKCTQCQEAHQFLDEYDILREGGHLVGGFWGVLG